MKKIFKKRSVWVLTSIYLASWLTISIVGGVILNTYGTLVNKTFGIKDYETINTETDEDIDAEYYKSSYVQTDSSGNVLTTTDSSGYTHQVYDDAALKEAALDAADQVQREGATLLWNNDESGLPLSSGDKVSLFSHSTVDYVYSGTGSGAARTTGASDMREAFTAAGLDVNDTLWDFYETGAGSTYSRTARTTVNEVPWRRYTDEVINSFSSYGDAAIILLSRQMGEGNVSEGGAIDGTMTGADTLTYDYFDLSSQEVDMIEKVIGYKDSGVFKKVIVLLNTPTSLNFTHLIQYKDDIDACMWIGQGGFEGLNEVGRIMTGQSIPSGHLPDTFPYSAFSAPAAVNGTYSYYTNAATVGLSDVAWQGTYYVYAEGIYVGYKYYETRYEDTVLNRYNATSTTGTVNSTNNWVYSEEVAFPFGYGASYTEFTYSDFSVEAVGDDYEVKLTVTNTGTKEGADAVQVYVQKPYTDHDREYNIEQSAVNLAGYAKTSMLSPGDHEEVTITVDSTAFRTYDEYDQKTYIYEEGDYYITAASDSHAAINNILAEKGHTPENTDGVMDAAGDTAFVYKFRNESDDYSKYSTSEYTSRSITNALDSTDWNKYENNDGTTVTYLSRQDWEGTYPTTYSFTITDGLLYDLGWNYQVEADPTDEMPLYEQDNGLKLIDMMGVDYDHQAWDGLLDQMSLEDQIDLIAHANRGTVVVESISKPSDLTQDGPMGLRQQYINSSDYTLSFPSHVLTAATFNDELAEEVGRLIGEDMLHAGYTGIYGPGANMHRTVWGGRSFEYCSEDGFITGKISAALTRGIQSTGGYVVMKHMALNDQEANRYGAAVWANEQTVRELYLVPFEIAVTEADARAIMSSFTRNGAKWSGSDKGMMTQILRDEWDFEGFVLSDASWREYMGVVDGVMAGNDAILDSNTHLTEYYQAETNATVAQAIREAAHRVLYVTANSSTMNGLTSNTEIIAITVWWEYLIVGLQIGLGVLTGLSVIMTVLSFVFYNKEHKVALETSEGESVTEEK